MKDVFIGQVGIWGQRHYQYLKENKATMVNVMRMNGTLKQYLREVDEQAEEMLYGLVRQMAKDEGVNEAIKRQDQMLWVQRMNSIRNRAEEIVLKDLITRLWFSMERAPVESFCIPSASSLSELLRRE